MTQINRLSQITEVADNDILPIWDYDSKRTRGVLASKIKSYATDNEIVNAKIVNDHLILITKQGDEIDAGELPTSSGIDVENDGVDVGEFSTLNFGSGLNVEPSLTRGVAATVTAIPSIPPNVLLDVAQYGDMNSSDWIALGNIAYSFENAKLSELSNSPANIYDYSNDPERVFSVIHGVQTINTYDGKDYITRTFYINEGDRPKGYTKEGYLENQTFNNATWQPITGLIVYKERPTGGDQAVPSAFLRLGGGIKAVFSGEETEIVAVAPFSDVVEIYENKVVTDPEDNRTYVYESSDVGDDHEFWLNLDASDVVDGYTITINVAPLSRSSLTIYTGKDKQKFSSIIPSSTIVFKKLPGGTKFTPFKSGGTSFCQLASVYCNLSIDEWKDLPINSYFVTKGTFAGFGDDVDGKQGQLFAELINTDIAGNENALIDHRYTIQSDDPTINGRVYQKVCRVKSEFANAPLVRISGYGDPADGFVMKSGKQIHVTENATIRLDGDMTSTFSGAEHNIIQPGDSHIIIGSNQVPLDIQFRNDGGDVTLQRAGTTHTFAYEDNTIEQILAGDNIAIDDSNPRFPKITATGGGGGGEDPSKGFTLNDNAKIRFVDTSGMLLQYDGGTHTLLDFAYDGASATYFTQFGAITTEFQIKTKNRPSVSENVGGFWTVAYDEENHIPITEWERSTQTRIIAEDELYKYIDFIFEPLGEGHVSHLEIPARTTWEKKFYIPGVNEDKQYKLPNIDHWRMSFTIPKDDLAATENHKLRLTSSDGLTNFDQDGHDVITALRGKRWVAFWARPKESAPSGWAGYVMKFSPDDESDFIPYSTYQAQGDVAYTGIPSNQETRIIDGVGYIEIDRQSPVVTSDDSTDSLVLIQINAAETDSSLATVRKVSQGTLASGFSLCQDGTAKNTQIIQIASGTYTLEQMSFAVTASVGDGVYVGEDGKLTLTVTDFQAGWVIDGGVVIDIDIYNRNVNNSTVDTFDVLTTRVLKVHEGPDAPETFTQVAIDGNKNTNIHAVGDTHYYRKDPETGDLTEIYQIDSTNRFVVKTKIKTPVITNLSSGSTNSNSENSAYIDLSKENKVNIGAYESVNITVAGEKIRFGQGAISFDDIGDGYIRNLGFMSRNSSNDNNSITLGDGSNTYKSNTHTFRDNLNNEELVNFTTEGQNLKNKNLKHVRHVVGNTPTSMFVANVGLIKRDDGDNNKDVIDFSTDSINIKSKKVEFNDDTGARRLTIENHKADWHSCQLNNVADGVADNDAATVGQLNAVGGGGIPYLRKFDSQGGTIYAHSYPEGRVQAWINYKGNGSSDVSIDSMRPISEGQTGQMYDMIALDNQSQNVCKLRLFYENSGQTVLRIMPGEVVQCWTSREFKRWKWQFGTESSPTGSTSLAIEENNDEIITPNKGEQFQLIDPEKTASYGNANKNVTYFAPSVGTQSETLLSKLDYGKVFAIHEEVNTTKLIMFIHESLVAEIYNRDLTDVNELTMLFTGNSRGRLGKSNQTAAAQFAINWNGELIPADDDPNEPNPTHWVAPDDSVTETWSNSVKSVCYSSGILANRGSAMLKRGDVIYSKPDSVTHDDDAITETPKHMSRSLSDSGETATIVYDDNSEFFVMPIIAGGGTFNVMKLFQLFMGRKSQYVEEWGSLKFDQSSDCIGTILKIAYDAAIAEEEKEEQTQNDELMEGLASGVIYAKTVTVG